MRRMEQYFLIGWTNPSQAFTFQFFFGENKRRTDVLLALELLEDSQVEINDLLSKFDEITFISVAFTFVDSEKESATTLRVYILFPDESDESLSNDEASCLLARSCPHYT